MKKSRAEDEVTLHILDLHRAGRSPEQIGKILGMAPRKVRDRIQITITEDCLADPEAEDYWYPDTKGPTK